MKLNSPIADAIRDGFTLLEIMLVVMIIALLAGVMIVNSGSALYVEPGKRNPDGFDLFSAGKDRQPGTDDDIGNWRES